MIATFIYSVYQAKTPTHEDYFFLFWLSEGTFFTSAFLLWLCKAQFMKKEYSFNSQKLAKKQKVIMENLVK